MNETEGKKTTIRRYLITRLGWMWCKVTNTLAYYSSELITDIKSTVQYSTMHTEQYSTYITVQYMQYKCTFLTSALIT
jgi:hypothetical protein